MKLKTLTLAALLSLFAATSSAEDTTCKLVIPYGPGGTTDILARALQVGNSDITIEYKPGAYASSAIAHMTGNNRMFMLGPPVMFSSKNPSKNKDNVDVLRLAFSWDFVLLSRKEVDLNWLFNKKANIGVSAPGLPQHAYSIEITKTNPLSEVIITGGEAKALPLLLNGDLDAIIVSEFVGNKWATSFPEKLKILSTIKQNNSSVINVADLNFRTHPGQAIYTNKNISQKDQEHISACVNKAFNSKETQKILAENGVRISNLDKENSWKAMTDYLEFVKQYGF